MDVDPDSSLPVSHVMNGVSRVAREQQGTCIAFTHASLSNESKFPLSLSTVVKFVKFDLICFRGMNM